LSRETDRDGAARCFVYVIAARGRGAVRTYVGWTTDLERRLARHNAGTGAKFTRGRRWVLLYAERHADKREAMRREWHLKRDRTFRAALRAVWLSPRRRK
jgi:putative endonuclease